MADEETPKHPGGRPLIFESVSELEQAINSYFDSCDPHVEVRLVEDGVNQKGETIFTQRKVMTPQKPYTLSGLARALGINRATIKSYGDREEFSSTIAAARERCEEYSESQLYGPYSNGAKFSLSNNYEDWREKQEIDHLSGGKGFFLRSKMEIEVVEDPQIEDQQDSSDSAGASQ